MISYSHDWLMRVEASDKAMDKICVFVKNFTALYVLTGICTFSLNVLCIEIIELITIILIICK